MHRQEVRVLLEKITDAIQEIDRECSSLGEDVEHGLVNVKLEFKDRAYEETGKALTEEPLIAWLISQKLRCAGHVVGWEVPYPAVERKKCDLVLGLGGSQKLWLELKLAWKAWFNCGERPVFRNPSYLGYLWGGHRSHSFRHDLEKLGTGDWPIRDFRAVCLIGTDSAKAPMDADVGAVVEDVRVQGITWTRATERHWLDRRCPDFRVNVWTWVTQQAC
jgi:hypothetical protein